MRRVVSAAYPLYFVAVIVALFCVDVPYLVDSFLPGAWETPYELPAVFLKAETAPDVLRKKTAHEESDILRLGHVPSLKGIDPAAFFRDPSFREETTPVRRDGRYEEGFSFSVRPDLARVFLFGDSYLVSFDYKPLAYVLNEEARIPTWRRSYGAGGSMETVYSFLAETPERALRGRHVVFVVSEGSSVWVNRQLNGMPLGSLLRYPFDVASYYARRKWGIRWAVPSIPASPDIPPTPRAEKISSLTLPGGGILREDPSHLNPVLFEYRGQRRAIAFFPRNLALATWHEPYIRGRGPAASLENWIARIGRLARKKGAYPVVLYIPSKLSAYWPILEPVLDYGKMHAYIGGHGQANKTIRSPEELRAILPLSIRAWREVVTESCRREGVGIIDLTDPYREATQRGETVYRDFDTHWSQRGIELAKDGIEDYVRGGKGR